jgi:cation-transporting ATPase F
MWHAGMLSNRWILGGVTVQAVGQIAITYVPAMNSLFQTTPIAQTPGCACSRSRFLPR